MRKEPPEDTGTFWQQAPALGQLSRVLLNCFIAHEGHGRLRAGSLNGKLVPPGPFSLPLRRSPFPTACCFPTRVSSRVLLYLPGPHLVLTPHTDVALNTQLQCW